MHPSDRHADLLQTIPDVPRWVEARAILLADCGRVFTDGGGRVIRNEQPGGQLAVVVGSPGAETLAAALSDRSDREVLCAPEDESVVARLCDGWSRERALLYRLARPAALAPAGDRVRLLEPSDSLAHLEGDLQGELDRARPTHEIHAGFVGGLAASFAYAHWQTEGQFDISIDTAPAYRRRGLARSTASALVRAQLEHGRRPVWGAMASNVASQQLAEGLGFERVDEVVLFTRG